MNNSEFFKPFPKYEDVFYDDIENHKKYFLPICSVNLKFIDPSKDEWLHFISVKEIYTGCVGDVGEYTNYYYTRFTKEDMFGFDIIDGKYKFDAPWDYFLINHKDKKDEELKIIEIFEEKFSSNRNKEELDEWITTVNASEWLKWNLRRIFGVELDDVQQCNPWKEFDDDWNETMDNWNWYRKFIKNLLDFKENIYSSEFNFEEWLARVLPKNNHHSREREQSERSLRFLFDLYRNDRKTFESHWKERAEPALQRLALDDKYEEIYTNFKEKISTFDNEEQIDEWLETIRDGMDLEGKERQLKRFFRLYQKATARYERELNRLKYAYRYAEELPKYYEENTKSFEVGKAFYEKYHHIYRGSLSSEHSLQALEENIKKRQAKYPDSEINYPEFFGFLDDIRHQASQKYMEEEGLSLEDMDEEVADNVLEKPHNNAGKVFTHIGVLCGYYFQMYGADGLHLFHSDEMKKAVICLEYAEVT